MPVIIDDRDFSDRDYLAPTVYRLAGKTISGWNYYRTQEDAITKLKYLMNQGGANVPPIGSKSFPSDGSAVTLGINVDFYTKIFGSYWPISYKYLREPGVLSRIGNEMIYRFYTVEGNGPYWAIFNTNYFGISATPVAAASTEKLAALDSFQREITLMKYRYNYLAGFLNDLAKRTLTPTEQQIFNQGVLLINNMRAELMQVQGIDIKWTPQGTIGVPVFLIIGIIAILSAATAWTISEIYTQKEKTRRINESYDLTRWVANKKTEVAQLATAGTITQSQANDINQTLDQASAVANKVAINASKNNPGLFGEIGNIVKWGVIGMFAYAGIQIIQNQQRNRNAVSTR